MQMINRLPAVKDQVGLSRSTIYKMISEGSFPAPISLGPRAVGWLQSEIEAWLDKQIKFSRESISGSSAKPGAHA
jgi:prophage regulatory protein